MWGAEARAAAQRQHTAGRRAAAAPAAADVPPKTRSCDNTSQSIRKTSGCWANTCLQTPAADEPNLAESESPNEVWAAGITLEKEDGACVAEQDQPVGSKEAETEKDRPCLEKLWQLQRKKPSWRCSANTRLQNHAAAEPNLAGSESPNEVRVAGIIPEQAKQESPLQRFVSSRRGCLL
jgi:hypothetical protein